MRALPQFTIDINDSWEHNSIDKVIPNPPRTILQTQPAAHDHLFRVVWRWHFYAGVLVGLPLVVLAVTGGLYVFRDEVVRAWNADVAFVAPGQSRVSYAAQVDAARESLPAGYQATGLEINDRPDRSTAVTLTAPKQPARRVGVDPYTGQALGAFADDRFFPTVLSIHRQLMVAEAGRVVVEVDPSGNVLVNPGPDRANRPAGGDAVANWKFALDPGRLVTELATSWTVVLLATGLYLWWPRRKEKVRGVLVPRLRAKRYTVLRDLHTLAGLYFLPVVFVVALTGLLYSSVWGSGYRYAVRHTDANGFFTTLPKSTGAKGKPFPLDEAVALARERFPGHPLSLTLPRGAEASYVFFVRGHTGPPTQGLLVLHRTTGAVLFHKPLAEFPAASRWAMWNFTLHVGSFGGVATKVIWTLACLVMVGLPLSGLWMWWQRRPRGRVGLPRRPAARVPGWVVGSALLLGILLPTVGGSVILILAAEWLAGRLARLRRPRPTPDPTPAA